MTTAAKQRGTTTERMVVRLLQKTWPGAERRALAGTKDKGDVVGVPLHCLEVKGARDLRLPAWKAETLREQENAGAEYCGLIVRVERKPVEQWDFYVPLEELGMPIYGEDAWARMPLHVGVEVIKARLARHIHYSQSSLPTG